MCGFGGRCWFQHLPEELTFFLAREKHNQVYEKGVNNISDNMDVDESNFNNNRGWWTGMFQNSPMPLGAAINNALPARRPATQKDTALPEGAE